MKFLIFALISMLMSSAHANNCNTFFSPKKRYLNLDNLPVEMDTHQFMRIIRDESIHNESKMEAMGLYINDNIDLGRNRTTELDDNGALVIFKDPHYGPVDVSRIWQFQNQIHNMYTFTLDQVLEILTKLDPKLDLSHGDIKSALSEFDHHTRGTDLTTSDLWERDLHPMLTQLAIYNFGLYPRQDSVKTHPLPSLEEAPFNMTLVVWLLASLRNDKNLIQADITPLQEAAYSYFKECSYCRTHYPSITQDDFNTLVRSYLFGTNQRPIIKSTLASPREDTW